MSPRVGIIDYKTGNSRSFSYALDHIGVPNALVHRPEDCEGITHFVLPGVGAAAVTMDSLANQGWITYLEDKVLHQKTPFLGVCVGLQVLFDFSSEGDVECLGWLPGVVDKFNSTHLRVPHMGWNHVNQAPFGADTQTFPNLFGPGGYFYFVNSFYAKPSREEDILGVTNYGQQFASVVGSNNILATQFHLEKSGQEGLKVLRRFVDTYGKEPAQC